MTRPHEFSRRDKQSVYDAIYGRRDVREGYLPDPVPDEVLARVLDAAHHAPSVGFMQPWNFILIDDPSVKDRVKEAFERANEKAAQRFGGARGERYRSLKLEGILEAPVNLVITCDTQRHGPVVLGTTSQPHMDLYSTVCAVQNLWLSARAEGLGCGWVSILDPDDLRALLKIPDTVEVVAYLCLGYVEQFERKPDLERAGWLRRLNPADLLKHNSFTSPPGPELENLQNQLRWMRRPS